MSHLKKSTDDFTAFRDNNNLRLTTNERGKYCFRQFSIINSLIVRRMSIKKLLSSNKKFQIYFENQDFGTIFSCKFYRKQRNLFYKQFQITKYFKLFSNE